MKKTLLTAAAALAIGAGSVSQSQALPILGGYITVASDGDVIAKFLGHTAGYSNDLYLDSPSGAFTGLIFNNQSTPVGTTVNLGYFSAGTELIFRIHVNNTGEDFFSGPASRNPDGLAHAVVDDEYSATETYVGFEDLLNGGDRDYDDVKFSFNNVRGTTNPVPDAGSSMMLFSSAVAGLGLLRRRVAK